MLTVALPSPEGRLQVRSFWLTLGVVAAGVWLGNAWWRDAPHAVAPGVGVGGLLALVPFIHEGVARRVYAGWNRRLVRPIGVALARVVMWTCFFIIFVAVGRAGSRMSLAAAAGASTWTPRTSLPPDAYRALSAHASSHGASGAWISDYLRWATETGNLWSASLLPFLIVLRLLPRDEEKAAPANLYTLF